MRLADLATLPPTLKAEQTAEILDCSTWALYESVKNGGCPVEPIRVGRCLRWPTAAVLRVVGIDPTEALRTVEEPG